MLIGRVKPLRPASALGPRGGRGEDSARWARRSGVGGGTPRPGPQTPPAPPHAAPAVFHWLLRLSLSAKGERGWERKKERLRIGTEASGTFSDPSALTPCSHAGRQRRRPVLPEPRETERGRTRGFRKLLGAAAASPFLSSPRPEAREGREAIGDGSGLVAGCPDGGSQAPWPTVPWGISFGSFDDSACASGHEKASDRAKRDAEAKPPRSGRDAAQLRSAAPCAGPREAVLIPGPAQAPEQRGPRGRERV